MQRNIQEIDADFDRLLSDFDAEMRRLGVYPDPQQGEAKLREFARAGNLIFYHCGDGTIPAASHPSVRER